MAAVGIQKASGEDGSEVVVVAKETAGGGGLRASAFGKRRA